MKEQTTLSNNQKSDAPAKELPTSYVVEGDEAIFKDFIAEAEEHLCTIENNLGEKASLASEELDEILRSVHCLKGGGSYFNLVEMTRPAHTLEALLEQIRKGSLLYSTEIKDTVLSFVYLERVLLPRIYQAFQSTRIVETDLNLSKLFLKAQRIIGYIKVGESNLPHAASHTNQILSPQGHTPARHTRPSKQESYSTVRIETARVDRFVDRIHQLSDLTKKLAQHINDPGALIQAQTEIASLNNISNELFNIAMSISLTPIHLISNKLKKVCGETAKVLGKKVEFKFNSQEMEYDRATIERLSDPLVHLVRNALDHGIEDPDNRALLGKNEIGCIAVTIRQSSTSLTVVIEDDGRGLDPHLLYQRAQDLGFIAQDQLLQHEEIYNIIFKSGFSICNQVSDISGRGVGLDVVHHNIEEMNGTVAVDSKKGEWTRFAIEIPNRRCLSDSQKARQNNKP